MNQKNTSYKIAITELHYVAKSMWTYLAPVHKELHKDKVCQGWYGRNLVVCQVSELNPTEYFKMLELAYVPGLLVGFQCLAYGCVWPDVHILLAIYYYAGREHQMVFCVLCWSGIISWVQDLHMELRLNYSGNLYAMLYGCTLTGLKWA